MKKIISAIVISASLIWISQHHSPIIVEVVATAPTTTKSIGAGNLSDFTYNALMSDTSLSPTDKVKVAKALAPSFNKIASEIVSIDNFKDVIKQVLPALKESNNAALQASGVPIQNTLSFKSVMSQHLYELYNTEPRKLVTADDFAVAFREIAEGLNNVAR